jgi:hypothetical protein
VSLKDFDGVAGVPGAPQQCKAVEVSVLFNTDEQFQLCNFNYCSCSVCSVC